MSFFGAVRLLVAARHHPSAAVSAEAPPEIPRGAWAAWATEGAASRQRRAAFGDACRTRVGREGRLVEIIERGQSVLVCQES